MGQDTHIDTGESVDDSADGRLPDSVVEDLLSTDRCRHLLSCLATRDEPIAVEDLACLVGARERDATVDDIGDGQARDIRDDIYQHHLPKLTATEVVSYDSLLGTVELDTASERLIDELPEAGQ